LDRLQNIETFPTWLATIVVRTSNKLLRRRRLMKRFGLWKPPEIDWEQVRSNGISTEDAFELRVIYRLVHDMPAELRVPLVLRHVEDKSLQEIADLVGTSIATVKRRIVKAQALLTAAMREAGAPEHTSASGNARGEDDDERQAARVAGAGRRDG
jgi:RNA polymerase sigma-70 factor (ECF subfamily)